METVTLSAAETEVLQRELREAREALAAAHDAETPLDALVDLTAAVDTLWATQHELVNVLLERGATWSQSPSAVPVPSAVSHAATADSQPRPVRPPPRS